MKARLWNIVLLCVVSAFLVSAVALILGYFEIGIAENPALPAGIYVMTVAVAIAVTSSKKRDK